MDRTLKLAFFSLIFNIAFTTYYIVFGVTTHSWWLFTLGLYYAILSMVRFVVLCIKKQKNGITKFTGVMLMLLTLPLIGTVILAVVRDRGSVMHEIVMITMATYSFTKITFAIINLIKVRKSVAVKLIALRNISLSDAFVSIFALQRSMLVSFGEMAESDICIFNAVVGGVVCMIVFLLGFNLVQNRKVLFRNLNGQTDKINSNV